jgi:hypothetical protein
VGPDDITHALPTGREVAWHEAHHAAALCLAGLTPLVARTDWPTPTLAGVVKPDWERHPIDDRTMGALLVAILMGPISEGEPVFTHVAWPIDPDEWQDGCQADAAQLSFVAQWLGLDLVDYMKVVCEAGRLAKDLRYRRLVVAIAHALERDEIVLQPELEQLTQETGWPDVEPAP